MGTLRPLVLVALVVDAALPPDVGAHFWDGACGNHDLHFQGPFMPKTNSSIRFVAISLVVRHGARNFLNDPRRACHARSAGGAPPTGDFGEILESTVAEVRPPIEAHFDFESVADVPTLVEPPSINDDNRCKGCLLHTALTEFRDLGDQIRDTYFPLLERKPTLENSWFYSTNNDRNVESLYLLRHSLFPGEPEIPVAYFTRKVETDPWAGHTDCPSAAKQFIRSNRTLPPMYAGFGKQWRADMGAEFTWACHDPMIVAWCTSQWNEVLDMPLSRDSATVQEAFRIYGEMYAARYMEHQDANALMVAPVVFELVDMLRRQAADGGYPFTAWSTQDVVIASILVGLGLWDEIWPQYAEAVVFELYKDLTAPQRVLFRLLRRGVPLVACKTPTADGLCDLDTLIPASLLALRNSTRWREACLSRLEEQTEPVEVEEIVISPWIAVLPLMSVLVIVWMVSRCRQSEARASNCLLLPGTGFRDPLLASQE